VYDFRLDEGLISLGVGRSPLKLVNKEIMRDGKE